MSTPLPRLGFLGTGWIGRHRLAALQESGEAEIAAIADVSEANAREAAVLAPEARLVRTLDELLALELDGIVIATPSAGHCQEAIRALEHGLAVFCQKPLARTARETAQVVDTAHRVDRLLGVDFSYRHTEGIRRMYDMVKAGEIGNLFAADLVFHNAYGPDKEWFYDARLSGGGCLMDLGSHLLDLALWFFDFEEIRSVFSSIFAEGRRISSCCGKVEDYAEVSLVLESGSVIRLACSWNLPAGRDAAIGASFFGTRGGLCFRNTGGSFYDFVAEHFQGTTSTTIATPPDPWGGRAAIAWCRQLRQEGGLFDPSAEHLISVATALDAAYGRPMVESGQPRLPDPSRQAFSSLTPAFSP